MIYRLITRGLVTDLKPADRQPKRMIDSMVELENLRNKNKELSEECKGLQARLGAP